MKKRFLAALLCLCMVLSLLPTAAFAAGESGIQLGTAGLKANDEIYFGNYTQSGTTYDVPWIVLSKGTNEAFLLSKFLLGDSQFQSAGISYYSGSTLNAYMDALYNGTGFTSQERGAIATRTNLSCVDGQDDDTNSPAVPTAHLYPLSYNEAAALTWGSDTLKAPYITNQSGSAWSWWLRSSRNADSAVCVDDLGHDFGDLSDTHRGARPAFNLDLSSVLFTSAAVSGKISGTAGADALTANKKQVRSGNEKLEWKMTLLDSARSSFTAGLNSNSSSTVSPGGSVKVDYSNAKTGKKEYVSAALCDADGNILYYGNIASNSASGTATVTIPAGLPAGSYKLNIFSEQCNGDKNTDYASEFEGIDLTVKAMADTPLTPYNVWVGATQVTSVNASDVLGNGTVSYEYTDAAHGILTLNNANIDTAYSVVYGTACIYSEGVNMTIKLVGNSTVTGVAANSNENSYGICIESGKLTIFGSGSLSVTGASDAEQSISCGIFANDQIFIDEGTVITTGGGAKKRSYGIASEDERGISIKGGSMLAKTASTTGTASAVNAYVSLSEYTNYLWRTDESGTFTLGSATAFTNDGNSTYAEVRPYADFSVTFDTDGGTRTSGGALSQTVIYGNAAVAPTVEKDGHTFHGWDKPLTNITVSQTITAKWTKNTTPPDPTTPTYQILDGTGQTISDLSKGASFRADMDLSNFSEARVDNKTVASENITVTSGSTIITLKPACLATLAQGKHTIAIVAKDGGMATAEFTIATKVGSQETEVPQTGDHSNLILWVTILLVSGGATTTLFVATKRRKDTAK